MTIEDVTLNPHPSDLQTVFRSTLAKIAPYNAGKSLSALDGSAQGRACAKLNSNENPFGLLPGVEEQIKAAAANAFLYPDSEAQELRTRLAERLNVAPNRLTFGNGSEDLLSVICRAVLEAGDRVITLYPSFPLHEDYALLMGADVERIPVLSDLRIDAQRLVERAKAPAKLLIFANPMNPVGSWLDPAQLRQLIGALHPQTLLVVDEAYIEYAVNDDFVSAVDLLAQSRNPWIILRTFSKAWGLAGLRLGFGITSSTHLCAGLDLARTPFNTNALAQVTALASLDQEAVMIDRVAHTTSERERVAGELRGLGFAPAQSRGNFLMFDAGEPSDRLADRLADQGTLVKPWKQAGFTNFMRVSIGTRSENDKFLRDLRRVAQPAP